MADKNSQLIPPPNRTDNTRGNEEIFRLLIDATPDYAIFAIDPNGFVLTWNKGAQRLKGYTEEEIIGRHFSTFYEEADRKRDHPAHELRIALKEGRYEEEGWRLRKDGSRFWANLILTPIRDAQENHLGFMKVTRDLTDKKLTDEHRWQEQEKFRLMVESVKDYAILMLDSTGHVSSWNEGAKRFKGYEAHEILGLHFSRFYPDVDIRAKKPEMELEIAEKTGRFEDEGWRVRKDGTLFWANVVITALFDQEKKLVGFSKVTRDLSERKKAEESLRKAYGSLELKIREKTSELEDALKIRDEFLSIASHELKTPITSIKMQIQMATQRTKKEKTGVADTDKLLKTFHIVNSQLDRLASLIDDLLDISLIQAGKLSYHYEPVNLNSLIHEVIENYGEPLSTIPSKIKVYADPDLEGIWDRSRIEQVIVNLISNAVKYAPLSSIVIFAKQDEDFAHITVQDFGPGIPEKVRGKLFGKFERLGQTRNVGGLGLGLYICRQIVLGHGGSISLKPGDDLGTTFVIRLPLNSQESTKT